MSTVASPTRHVALERFSGSGHFSRSWRRRRHIRHIHILEIGLRHCVEYDMCAVRLRAVVHGWITAGLVLCGLELRVLRSQKLEIVVLLGRLA